MTTLAAGSTVTVAVRDGGIVAIATNGGIASAVVSPTEGGTINVSFGPTPERRTLGPYAEGASIIISNQSCGAFDYDVETRFDPSSVDIRGGTVNGVPITNLRVQGVTQVGLPSNISHNGIGTFTLTTGLARGGLMLQQTIMLPCGVDAVSISPLHNSTDVSTFTGILGYVQTSDLSGAGSDLKNPYFQSAVQTMQQVTWNNGSTSGTYTAVANNQLLSGAWSDWIPVVNTGTGAPSYLIVRVYYPAGVTPSLCYFETAQQSGRIPALQQYGGNAYFGFAGSNVGASNAASLTTNTACPPVLVKFATSKRVASVAQYGDSTRQGWYGNGVLSAIERCGIVRSVAGSPTACSNRAITGQTSAQYLTRLQADVAAGDRFDVLFWQVASPNDTQNASTSSIQIANAHAAIRIAQSIGARVVLEGPFPFSAGTPSGTQLAIINGAKTFCQAMDGIRPGISAVYFDGLHDATTYGKWIAAYNNAGDGSHPSELGITAVILPQITAAVSSVLTGL